MSPTHQDLSNDTTFSQIKSRVPVPFKGEDHRSDEHPPQEQRVESLQKVPQVHGLRLWCKAGSNFVE